MIKLQLAKSLESVTLYKNNTLLLSLPELFAGERAMTIGLVWSCTVVVMVAVVALIPVLSSRNAVTVAWKLPAVSSVMEKITLPDEPSARDILD